MGIPRGEFLLHHHDSIPYHRSIPIHYHHHLHRHHDSMHAEGVARVNSLPPHLLL
jgi:hypothetical protein